MCSAILKQKIFKEVTSDCRDLYFPFLDGVCFENHRKTVKIPGGEYAEF